MISAPDRKEAIKLIDEAVQSGASISRACEELCLSERTYYRWQKMLHTNGDCTDGRPTSVHPTPASKISDSIRESIIRICNEQEFQSKSPAEIVPILADRGIYIASERTFYRVLKEASMLAHRGRTSPCVHRSPATYVATAPNQVWMWDITYLRGPHKGTFFYLYLFSDLYDRSIVGWEVYEDESAEHASALIRRITLAQKRLSTEPLVLHSDNGSPMKGATMVATLHALGITPSNSRPRVSNDNPYAESLFRTLKYCPSYEPHGFATLSAARKWVQNFVNWYNCEHCHSGLNFLTPEQKRKGEGRAILQRRHEVYEKAKIEHPERWHGRKTRNWRFTEKVYLNPDRDLDITDNQ